MKILRLGAVAFFVFTGAARAQSEGIADFQGTVHTDKNQTIPSRGRVFISPAAVRVEWVTDLSQLSKDDKAAGKAPPPQSFQMVMIQKVAEPDRTYSISDRNRTYSVTMIAPKSAGETDLPERRWKLDRRGRDRVAGFPCEKAMLTAETGDQTEVCVATDWTPSTAWLAAWNSREEQSGPLKALQKAGLSGFPVRWIFRHKGQEKAWSSVELVRFTKEAVPASRFEIPPGYRKVESVLDAPALTPEQEQQLRQARQKMQEALDRMTPEQRKQYEEMLRQRTPSPKKP